METEDSEKIDSKGKSYGCMVTIFTMIIVVVAVVLGIYFFGEKDATNDDVTINEGTDNIISYTFTFIPKTDIKDLEFKISFYDSNDKYISNITKNVGNVKKGQQYTTTVNITELSFSQAFSSKISVTVCGGKAALISF